MITWTFDLRLGSIPWRDIPVRIWHWYISVWRGRRGPPVSWCRRCCGIQPQATWQNGHEWTQQYLLSLGKRRATRCCHGMRIFTILAGIFWLYYSIKIQKLYTEVLESCWELGMFWPSKKHFTSFRHLFVGFLLANSIIICSTFALSQKALESPIWTPWLWVSFWQLYFNRRDRLWIVS